MSDGEPLTIKLRNQTGDELSFKIKGRTLFRKVFNAYASRMSLDEGSLKFIFEGQRVQGNQTPDEFEMEEGDVVDVMIEQVGGGACKE